jgi:3-hydroxyisobutyrate dehydrogenase and related beta-hydroxyacid dehydrogenases
VAMAFSRAFTLLGHSGAGQLAKMVNQICIAGLVQGLAEAVAFGQNAGLDMKQVLDVIGKGAAQSWQMDNRGKTMVDGQFDFGFAVDWMRKDLGLVLDEARRNGSRLPVTALVDQFLCRCPENGWQPLGHVQPGQAPDLQPGLKALRRSPQRCIPSCRHHPRRPSDLGRQHALQGKGPCAHGICKTTFAL